MPKQVTETENVYKFSIATDRLRDFLSKAFLYNSDTAFESVVLEITPKFITVKDMSLEVIGVYLIASQRMFKEYSVPEGTNAKVTLRNTILSEVQKRFKSDDTVALTITDKTIRVQGAKEYFEDDLLVQKKGEFQLPVGQVEIVKDTKVLVPEGALEKKSVIAEITVASILDLPKVKTYGFAVEDGVLKFKVDSSISNDYSGHYGRDLEVKTSIKAEPVSVEMEAGWFDRMAHNLEENVFFLMDDMDLVLTKTTPELVTMYVMCTNVRGSSK